MRPPMARARSGAATRTPRSRASTASAGPLAGVDEAGRGPVLGPLVVAGVCVEDEAALAELGVRDSKKLTPAKREELFPLIHAAASAVAVRVVEPADLDLRMGRASLNRIEEDVFGDVLNELGAPRAVVDACDVDAHRFGLRVRARVGHECVVVAEHKADDRHLVVAAASVVAKVTRDRVVAELAVEYGEPVGSGYASDPVTQDFLKRYVDRVGALPPCARGRWETASRLVPKNRSLLDFSG